MPKTPPPLLGFNNNVRHQGRVFHIQTEDSGVKRPHVITHLFADGGRILKSSRTEYSEHVGREDLAQVVRKIMKDQHKAMFIALRRGDLDAMILEAFGPPPTAPAPSTPVNELSSDPIAAPPPEDTTGATAPRPSSIPKAPAPPVIRESQPELTRTAPPTPSATPKQGTRTGAGSIPEPVRPRPHRAEEPPRHGTPAAGTPAVARPKSDPDHGRYAVKNPPSETAGRYSVSRPASIFGEAPPKEGRSIFGDEYIGEKSLDEVILSYLAEDLESPPQK